MVTWLWVNIGSGNGMLPEDTKPLTAPMLIYHLWGQVIVSWGLFCKISQPTVNKKFQNNLRKISFKYPRGQWVYVQQFLYQTVTNKEAI